MIEGYFKEIEATILSFEIADLHSLTQKVYNQKQGFIKGTIFFSDKSRLDFVEVKDIEKNEKIKYRYHYMDKNHRLIFRYDNAKHHRHIATFPHHKHLPDRITRSGEPGLIDVLQEIKGIVQTI